MRLFDPMCRRYNALADGHVVCPYCHSTVIEPGNRFGLAGDVGRPIYVVRPMHDDNSNLDVIRICDQDNILLKPGIHQSICPNCARFYFTYLTTETVTTFRYRTELNSLPK